MPQSVRREGFVDDKDDGDSETVTPIRQIEHDASPPEEEQPHLFVSTWPMRIKLIHRPIRNNKNEEVSEIQFREPTGGDVNRYGAPVRMNGEGGFDIDDKKMAMIMAALSGINLPFLERMDPRDWQSCAYRLKLYFHPDATGWL